MYEDGCDPGPEWSDAENSRRHRFDPRTAQPVAGRYTFWAIPAHKCSSVLNNKQLTAQEDLTIAFYFLVLSLIHAEGLQQRKLHSAEYGFR